MIVLSAWLVAGLLLCAVGARRSACRAAPAAAEAPAADLVSAVR
ncbi:hypothetical protein [Actinoplanes sp. NPDC026623]